MREEGRVERYGPAEDGLGVGPHVQGAGHPHAEEVLVQQHQVALLQEGREGSHRTGYHRLSSNVNNCIAADFIVFLGAAVHLYASLAVLLFSFF